jgi:YidC/Oxa1 family membrane protein insertase
LTEYHNPQQDPGSEKRLLLAFLLVFVMIAAMQFLVRKQQPPVPQEKPAATPQGQQTPSPQATTAATPAAAKPAGKSPKIAVPKVAVKEAAGETKTVLENSDYRVVLTNHGALAESWVLKSFRDNDGNPLDLVNKTAAPVLGSPLSLFLYDKDLEKKVNNALYVATPSSAEDGTQSVSFEYSDGTVSVRKIFRIKKSIGKDFVLDLETEVTNNGQRVQAFPQWPSGMGDQSTVASFTNGKIDWQQDGKIEH